MGATHVARTEPSPNSSVGAAGASGTASGRAVADGPLASDQSTSFCAATVNVYSTSLVRPSIVQVVLAHCRTMLPGLATTR